MEHRYTYESLLLTDWEVLGIVGVCGIVLLVYLWWKEL